MTSAAVRKEWDAARAQEILQKNKHVPGALLPVLNALQEEFGYIDPQFVPEVAGALNISRAEVHGVVTFYHDFRQEPPGRHVVKLCRAEACQSMGGRALEDHVKARLGAGYHGKSAGGEYTLEPVYCLGNCACAPALMIDGKLHGRVTKEKFDALIAAKGATR
jgi:formate dehydrogenase subunit gamma